MEHKFAIAMLVGAAAVVGGVGGYTYSARQPLTVTSTDVSMNTPAGREALQHAREGLLHLDLAAAAVDSASFATATDELTEARAEFTQLAASAPDADNPVIVAQEAVIAHRFTPGPEIEVTDTIGVNGVGSTGMVLTRGDDTRPLALTDYSISFGDLNVDTQLATTHIDAALAATHNGDKAAASEDILAARGAITFSFNGDETGEI